MANPAEFQSKIREFNNKYPSTFMVVSSESDVNRLKFDKLSKDLSKTFSNSDADSALNHIATCLTNGNSVALQAAGSNNLFVHVGKGLF